MILPDGLSGERIRALCELESISRRALADRMQMSPAKLSKIEHGAQRFAPDLAHAMAVEFGLPIEFFVVHDPVAEAVIPTFRKRARALVMDERRVVRLAREAARVFVAVSEASGYRPFTFPDGPDLLDDEEQCAVEVRRAAGVGDLEPVPSVTRVLERQGVAVVAALEPAGESAGEHQGVTLPTRFSERPLIALVRETPGAVARFTLAHEMAHHLWDRDLPAPMTSTRDPRELRAHRFAGALLLPAPVVRRRVDEGTSLRGLLPLKAEFGVSVGAIIARARTVGTISDHRARSLQIQLSSMGWRDQRVEPVEVASERPLLFGQALARATDTSALGLARFTGLRPELVRHWAGIESPAAPSGSQAEVINLVDARARRGEHRRGVRS